MPDPATLAARLAMIESTIANLTGTPTPVNYSITAVRNTSEPAVTPPNPFRHHSPPETNPFRRRSSPSPPPKPVAFDGPPAAVPPPRDIRFSGSVVDASRFVSSMDDMVQLHAASFPPSLPRRAVLWVSQHLVGKAEEWYRGLSEAGSPSVESWTAFKAALVAAYTSSDSVARAARDLKNLVQTGSVPEYSAAFITLANRADMPDRAFLHVYFLDGLKEDIRSAVQLEASVVSRTSPDSAWSTITEYANSAERVELARRTARPPSAPAPGSSRQIVRPAPAPRLQRPLTGYAAVLRDNRPSSPAPPANPFSPNPPANPFSPPAASALSSLSSRPPPPHGMGRRPPGPLSADEVAYRARWGLCMFCGGDGHVAETCEMAKRSRERKELEDGAKN